MVTQVEIARRVGLDVSSVNKILNQKRGPVFSKATVRKVFRAARTLGFDFGRLKHAHRRAHPRKPVSLDVELSIYLDGRELFDRGKAILRDVSLSGARLGEIVLPRMALPTKAPMIGVRVLRGPNWGAEFLGRPVRLPQDKEGLGLAIEFPKAEEEKVRRLFSRQGDLR